MIPRLDTQIGYGSGYEPGTVVEATMNSTPQLDLGTAVADDQGNVTFTWQIPADAQLGIHTFSLTAEGYDDQSIEFRVVQEGDVPPPGKPAPPKGEPVPPKGSPGGELPRTGPSGAIGLGLLHPVTRRIAVLGVIAMHLGIALLMGLPWFSLSMIAFDAIFISAATYMALEAWLKRRFGPVLQRAREGVRDRVRSTGSRRDAEPKEPVV